MSDFEEKYGELLPVKEIVPEKKRFKVKLECVIEVEGTSEDDALNKIGDIKDYEWDITEVKEI